MFHRLIIVSIVYFLFPVVQVVAQEQSALTADELAQYQNRSNQLLHYLEDTFNFLGNPDEPVSEKEIIINDSYTKIFRDNKVQIEDDLDENRPTPFNKDVQAYMKDIMFFYKTVRFTFEINKVEQFVNEYGKIYFKITFNRRLQGITINNDTVDNYRIRYMEVNLNLADRELKIASIYTTKLNEKENLRHWWNTMSQPWKNYFGKSILVYDTLPLAMVQAFTDSTLVTPVWKSVVIGDTMANLPAVDSTRQKAPDSTITLPPEPEYQKVPDTIHTNTSILFKIVRKLQETTHVNISNNLTFNNIRPLSEMDNLREINLSNTLIDNLSPLHTLSKLEKLTISGTAVVDLSPLKYAWQLQEIDFSQTEIQSAEPLAGLANLTTVKGNNCRIPSLTPFNNHRHIRLIQMADCRITTIDSLQGLPSLTRLDLHSNNITTVDSIVKLRALQQLNLDSTLIKDIRPLSQLPSLNLLQINYTAVSELTPLLGLPHLKIIYCDNSKVNQAEAMRFMKLKPTCSVIFNSEKLESWWQSLSRDWKTVFKPFVDNEKAPTKVTLHKLIYITQLDISGRKEIASLKPLTLLHQLEELHLDGTSVASLAPLSELTQLTILTFENTPVSDISPLKNLQHLQKVQFSGTSVSNILPLGNSKNLQIIYCDNTRVEQENVSQLLNVLPESSVVFETRRLHFWWNNLDESWQNAFRKTGDFEENPTSEQLHRLIEMTTLTVENLPLEARLDALNVFFRLHSLTLNNTQVTDISPLTDLPQLTELHITNGPLSDLTGIKRMKNLQILVLRNTAINDLYQLSLLTNLKVLDISGTKVSNLKPLKNLVGIERLIINNTRVKNLKYIMGFQHLKLLKCYNTPLRTKKVTIFKTAHPETKVVFY